MESASFLTWAALLAHWTEMARRAVALPRTAEGEAWRASIPAIIGLQAVVQALGEIERLPAEERPVGLDRAAVLIRRDRDRLSALWGPGVPRSLGELVSDATVALEAAAARHAQGGRVTDGSGARDS